MSRTFWWVDTLVLDKIGEIGSRESTFYFPISWEYVARHLLLGLVYLLYHLPNLR